MGSFLKMNIHGYKLKLAKERYMLKKELSKNRGRQNLGRIKQIKDGMSITRYKIKQLRSEREKNKKK